MKNYQELNKKFSDREEVLRKETQAKCQSFCKIVKETRSKVKDQIEKLDEIFSKLKEPVPNN